MIRRELGAGGEQNSGHAAVTSDEEWLMARGVSDPYPSSASLSTMMASMRREIAARVQRVLRKQLELTSEHIAPSASLVDDLGADSLGLVGLALALEEEFEIDLSGEQVKGLRTVRDVIDCVASFRREPVRRPR